MREQGYFSATLYLEVTRLLNELGNNVKILDRNLKVELFGEFSEGFPWQVRVPCNYDEKFKCFKASVIIKRGQSFKFVLNGGQSYEVSSRYQRVFDSSGNENNLYDPKSIVRTSELKTRAWHNTDASIK